ncbi:MAG: DUF4129 domain-containing protein [Nitriliruptoraceae bacterium]
MSVPQLAALGHDPDVVGDLADRILGGPPYRAGEPGTLRRTIDAILDAIGRLLGDALGVVGGTPAVAWAIALLGLALLAAVVWRATRGATLGRRLTRAVPDAGRVRAAADWLAEADRHLTAGDLDAALRARYVAAVVTLEERGLLASRPGRTIRELDAELAARLPELAPRLAAAGRRVEPVVFAGHEATRGDLEVVDAALTAVRSAGRVEVGASR